MLKRMLLKVRRFLRMNTTIRAIILGSSGAGKTCLVRGFCGKKIVMREIDPTYGFDVSPPILFGKSKKKEEKDEDDDIDLDFDLGLDDTKEEINDDPKNSGDDKKNTKEKKKKKKIRTQRIVMWDFGTRKDQHRNWHAYYPGSDVVIWVVDARSERFVRQSAELLENVVKEIEFLPPFVPFCVLANKSDMKHSLGPVQIEKIMKLEEVLCDHEYHVFPVSAFAPPWAARNSKEDMKSSKRARFNSFAGLNQLRKRYLLSSSATSTNSGKESVESEDEMQKSRTTSIDAMVDLLNASTDNYQKNRKSRSRFFASTAEKDVAFPPLVAGKSEIEARPWGLHVVLEWIVKTVNAHRSDDELQEEIRSRMRDIQKERSGRESKNRKNTERRRKLNDLEDQLRFGMQRFGRKISSRIRHSRSETASKQRGPTRQPSRGKLGTDASSVANDELGVSSKAPGALASKEET